MNTGFTLFLDFDGVMTTKFSTLDPHYEELTFDPICVENLKRIIEQIMDKFGQITIIIISGWRYDLSEPTINDLLLRRYGLNVCLSACNINYLERLIGTKIENIKKIIHENQLTPEQCLILDDEYLGEELAEYQIRTRSEDGIRAIESLEQLISSR